VSQFYLATLYEKGLGVPEDAAEALKWYAKPRTKAMPMLKSFLHFGTSADKEYPRLRHCARWFHKAADQGHASAQSALGSMYSRGQGVPHDYGEAIRWYRKAAIKVILQASRASARCTTTAMASLKTTLKRHDGSVWQQIRVTPTPSSASG